MPDFDVMHLALNYARGSAIAVVETISEPLIGWAMEVAAVNLLNGTPTSDTRTSAQLKEFDRIHFHGNNGWARGFGADSAQRILRSLRSANELNKDLLLGYMVAKGHHGKAINRLAALIDKASGR